MGCVNSKNLPRRSNQRFKVINVDEQGNLRKPGGYIEITETEIVLYHKNDIYMTWPLVYIKRYGWELETFTFQSGRKCGDRAGVYVFQCEQAKELFETLQRQIFKQRNEIVANDSSLVQQNGISQTNQRSSDNSFINQMKRSKSKGLNRMNSETSNNGILNQENEESMLTASPDVIPQNQDVHLYTNTILPQPDINLPMSSTYKNNSVDSPINEDRYYMNVTPNDVKSDTNLNGTNGWLSLPEEDDNAKHCYANLNLDESLNILSQNTLVNSTLQITSRKVNYITLDLETTKDDLNNLSINDDKQIDGETKKTYAVIDYNKTVALSNSVNPSQEIDNEGSRKTRHNSTISDLSTTITRHSSSISD